MTCGVWIVIMIRQDLHTSQANIAGLIVTFDFDSGPGIDSRVEVGQHLFLIRNRIMTNVFLMTSKIVSYSQTVWCQLVWEAFK